MTLKDLWVLNRLEKPDPEREAEHRRELEDSGLKVGWKDRLAMLLAAFVTLVLPCLLILLLLCGIPLAIMGLFG